MYFKGQKKIPIRVDYGLSELVAFSTLFIRCCKKNKKTTFRTLKMKHKKILIFNDVFDLMRSPEDITEINDLLYSRYNEDFLIFSLSIVHFDINLNWIQFIFRGNKNLLNSCPRTFHRKTPSNKINVRNSHKN